MIQVDNLSKTFTLHNQGGSVIPVLSGACFSVKPGECVALTGASGAGKSTVMRILYGNYTAQGGSVRIGDVTLTEAEPRAILALRRGRWAMSASSCAWFRACRRWRWWQSRSWRWAKTMTPRSSARATC